MADNRDDTRVQRLCFAFLFVPIIIFLMLTAQLKSFRDRSIILIVEFADNTQQDGVPQEKPISTVSGGIYIGQN